MNIRKKFLKFWNFWPPFLFSGIQIKKCTPDFKEIIVKLKLRFWNANYVGTLYGGSLFSMVDPFYMVMLINNLGKEYIVWDKSASINYLKPGRSDVWAEFKLTEEDIDAIKTHLQTVPKMEWRRTVEIEDQTGLVIAKVEKVLSIQKKIKDKQDTDNDNDTGTGTVTG